MATKKRKAPVSRRALMARLRRHLAHEGSTLHTCREGSRAYISLGRYYTANAYNTVSDYHIDLELLARERGIMHDHEVLAD